MKKLISYLLLAGVPIGVVLWFWGERIVGTLGKIVGVIAILIIAVGIIMLIRKHGTSRWKPIVKALAVIIVIVLIYNYVTGAAAAIATSEDRYTLPAAPTKVEMAMRLRNAIELPFDTSFLFTARTTRTHFVPGTGCKEWVRKVKHTHSFIFENQNGRFEVLPGQEVSVGDSEWFALSAFGGPEAEVRINLSGCDSSKTKSPTSRGS